MTTEEINTDYEARYRAEINAGGSIEINHALPYVAVKMSNGDEYFFQGAEADTLLQDVPPWINEEVFILASAQSW